MLNSSYPTTDLTVLEYMQDNEQFLPKSICYSHFFVERCIYLMETCHYSFSILSKGEVIEHNMKGYELFQGGNWPSLLE